METKSSFSEVWRVVITRPDQEYYYKKETWVHLYIPLYIDWTKIHEVPLLPLFTILMEFEVVILIISATVNTIMAHKIYYTSLIHRNLKYLCFMHALEYYFFFVTQLIVMCYQVGWIWVGFNSTSDIILIICGFGKMYRLCSAVLIIALAVMERTIATWKPRSYETDDSGVLGIVLSVLKIVSSGTLTVLIVMTFMSYWTATAILVFTILVSIITVYILNYRNNIYLLHLEKEIVGRNNAYSLSVRYQLLENKKVFHIIRHFTFTLTGSISLALVILNIATKLLPRIPVQPYVVLLMEYVMVSTPIAIAFSMRFLKNYHPNQQEGFRIAVAFNASRNSPKKRSTSGFDEAGDVHFKSLDDMWK